MRYLLSLVLLVLFSAGELAYGQTDFLTANLTATASACNGVHNTSSQLATYTIGYGAAVFTIEGPFTGTVNFYASGDGGTSWGRLGVTPSEGGAPVNSATADGKWQANVAGYTHICMLRTAGTTGTVYAKVHLSPIAARSGAGGGGGGAGRELNHVSTVFTAWSNVTTGSVRSSGQGVAFTPVADGIALVSYEATNTPASGNTGVISFVYRTTGTIPAAGDVATGTRIIASGINIAMTSTVQTGTRLDTGLSVGTTYRYYLATQTSGSVGSALGAGGFLQVTEQ